MTLDDEKRAAALAAAALVEEGMTVGLGTGSTVAHFLPALARRRLSVRCVATSPATEAHGRALGLDLVPFDGIARFDLTVDGADQIAPDCWLIKGGGAAHTREKIVAAATERFVVIADSSKPVVALQAPVPLELLEFGLTSTLRLLGDAALRNVEPSPDGGVIADYRGDVADAGAVAAWLDEVPGVVAHGLFPPDLTAVILVGRGTTVERIDR